MLHTFCAYCWEYFVHIVGNILHTICTYATYYLKAICICAKYKIFTKNWAFRRICATPNIYYLHICTICAKYKYAECTHFAQMHSARIVHCAYTHYAISAYAVLICQLHASLPARASEQGNVIGSLRIYIYIYVCTKKL